MNIFQQIFTDHYEYIQYVIKPRPIVMENIEKMIHCGDSSYGGAMYGCEKCGKLKFVPFRCKCRLCPSCGTKYSIDRTNAMAFKIIKVQHRHCVFTIDSQLRSFFLKNRDLLNLLFDAVRSTFLRLFHNMNKSESFTPGFICVLHTFGRDLKWNPHIHCLISEGGLGISGKWRKVSHFNYKFLRNAFRTVLLKLMLDKLGPSFKPVISKCYHDHKEGFYVYAKPNKCNPNEVIKYIGRYLGRPVIATSRIDKYDGEFVTFHYNRHEDDKLVSETIPAVDFIKRVIRHVPDKHFKMVRYYGLYARTKEKTKHLHLAISPDQKRFILRISKWRMSIGITFGYDPLKCPCCGNLMTILEIYHNHKRVPLEDLLHKSVEKFRRQNPDALFPFDNIYATLQKKECSL